MAQDLTRFIRGHVIAVERRAAAYGKLLGVLKAFLAASRPFARTEDAVAARQLAHGIVARMLANPPAGPKEMLRLCRLCWPLDWRGVTGAVTKRLAIELKAWLPKLNRSRTS